MAKSIKKAGSHDDLSEDEKNKDENDEDANYATRAAPMKHSKFKKIEMGNPVERNTRSQLEMSPKLGESPSLSKDSVDFCN